MDIPDGGLVPKSYYMSVEEFEKDQSPGPHLMEDSFYNSASRKLKYYITLQSMMNVKLSKQRFRHCYENGLIKTIQMIPHNL